MAERVSAQQWATFVNDTTNRMPTGAGQNDPTVTTTDNQEKDYAWGDLDHDGFIDLVCVRKIPWTLAGGRRNVLFMNENGVLMDRTATKANTAINVPASEGVSQGMLDLTNDRDVAVVDVNNDGWLDVVTATTISDGQPRYIGHPRVYMNLGEIGGVWQGLQYDYSRIPQLLSVNGIACNPRFCSIAAGDVTGDGFADLYFGDYDSANETPGSPPEPAGFDMDNKLLINDGTGHFIDQSTMRMGATFSYPGVGDHNYLFSTFGAASVIADMNGDGFNDVIKQTALVPPQHVAIITNNASNVGFFNNYRIVDSLTPYFVSAGDLNNDGRLDLIITEDSGDRYMLNQGNDGSGIPSFPTSSLFSFGAGDPGEGEFGSQSIAVDLNNDGFNDVLIADVDVDAPGCSGRTHIYHNLGNVPNVTLKEEWPSIIPTNMLTGTHNIAVFDINNDGWKDIVLGRCSGTQVWMNVGVPLSVPSGTPALVNPSSGATFPVQVSSLVAPTVVAGSARLYLSVNGGPFNPLSLARAGGNSYTASIPAGACGDDLRFYLSVQANINGTINTFTLPVNAPTGYFSAQRQLGTALALNEEFEGAVAGWSVVNDPSLTGGAWEVADPNGTIFNGQQAAPEDDATPAPGVKCFVTQNGAPGGAANLSDVDGGPTHLLSPTLDASSGVFRISYDYWFFTSDASGDTLSVAVSNNNGSTWTPVTTYSATSSGWQHASFRISDYVTPTNQIRVRFSANDGVAVASVVEAGIDDFRLERALCTACPADINGSGGVNVDDLLAVITSWGACPGCPPAHCPADIAPQPNGNCAINVDDLLMVITGWGACPP